jgi:hypothetical protein
MHRINLPSPSKQSFTNSLVVLQNMVNVLIHGMIQFLFILIRTNLMSLAIENLNKAMPVETGPMETKFIPANVKEVVVAAQVDTNQRE